MKKSFKILRAAVRQAEQELDAASSRSALNAAAKRLMRAKQELQAAETARPKRLRVSGSAAGAAAAGG